MAEKNSLWKNIRNKAAQNRKTGAKPKKPTREMLNQERKIKAKKAEGGYFPTQGPGKALFKGYARGGNTGEDEDGIPYRQPSIPMEEYNLVYEPTNNTQQPVRKPTYKPKAKAKTQTQSKPAVTNDYSEPRYITERSTTATRFTPPISTKKEREGIPDYLSNEVKAIKLGLDVGQFTPAAPFAYAASLPFTTYDVGKDLYKGNYTKAGVDAFGFIPGANATKLAKNAMNSIDTVNDLDLDEKATGGYMYPDGGKISKDLYGNPIESSIINDPSLQRSYYDSRLDQIVLGSDYDNELEQEYKDRIIAHENYHANQYKKDRSTLLPIKDIPYKKPSAISTDEVYYDYHNRKPIEAQNAINEFKKSNPGFSPVPDDIIYKNIVDPEQYLDTSTMEGEAKFYEDLGADISQKQYKYGGTMKKFKKKYLLGGGTAAGGGMDANSAMGGLNVGMQAYQANAQAIDMGNNLALGLIDDDNPYKDFAAQEMARSGKIAKINPWAGIAVDIIGKKKRKEEFDKGVAEKKEIENNNIMQANDLSGYAQDAAVTFAQGGNIHIKPENRGKFTASAEAAGHSVQEHARAVLNDPNATPLQKKRANFARNAAKWKHAYGGSMPQSMYAQGGSLTEIEGPSHEDGGVELTNQAEAEGGEIKADDYILSNRLGDKNGTFADQMKKEIKKGSPLRDSKNDPVSRFRIMNKKNELIAMNEEAIADMKNIMMSEASGESPKAMRAMGGYLKKKKLAYGSSMYNNYYTDGGPGRRRRASSSYTGSVPLALSLYNGQLPGGDMTTQEIDNYTTNLFEEDAVNSINSLLDRQSDYSYNRPLTEENARYFEGYRKKEPFFIPRPPTEEQSKYMADYNTNTPLNVDNPVNPATAITEEEAILHGWNPAAKGPALNNVGTSNLYNTQPPGPYREGVSGVSNTPLTREEAGWTQPPIDNLQSLRLSGYPDNLELPNNQPAEWIDPADINIRSSPGLDSNGYPVSVKPGTEGFETLTPKGMNTALIPNDVPLKLDETGSNVSLPSTRRNTNSVFGADNLDYLSMGVGALGSLSQLYYGLKGPDEVRKAKFNLARPSKVNYTPTKRLVSQEIDTAFNAADNDLRNNAPGAGSYLSNRIASAVKRARTKGENLIKLDESAQNAQIQNQFNQYNSGVLNQQELANLGQEDKIIQEKDAARQAVSEGLSNIGQSVGQGIRDRKSYNMQELKAKWSGTKDVKMIDGVKYYKQSDGSYKPEELKG